MSIMKLEPDRVDDKKRGSDKIKFNEDRSNDKTEPSDEHENIGSQFAVVVIHLICIPKYQLDLGMCLGSKCSSQSS